MEGVSFFCIHKKTTFYGKFKELKLKLALNKKYLFVVSVYQLYLQNIYEIF